MSVETPVAVETIGSWYWIVDEIEAAGFRALEWEDATREARDWFRSMVERARNGEPPPIGLHLLLGPEMRGRAQSLLESLPEAEQARRLAAAGTESDALDESVGRLIALLARGT